MSNQVEKTWESRASSTIVGPIDPLCQPKLAEGVRLAADRGKMQLEFADQRSDLDASIMSVDAVIPLDAHDGERLARIRELLDGHHTVEQIATRCDWNREECARYIQWLYERAIVSDAVARPAPALSFYRHIVAHGRRESLRLLGRSPLIDRLLGGDVHKRLIVGYLVEEYHYVCSAASNISPVIAGTHDERLRMMFSDYLSGEYWHGALLKRGLLAAGIGEHDLRASDPLPGTLAVINLTRETARTDLLAYSACLSIAEGGDVKSTSAFTRLYDLVVESGVVSPDVLTPSREHAELDGEGQHQDLGAEPFAEEILVAGSHQETIYRAVMATAWTQLEQHRQIAAYYGDPDGPLAHSYRRGWKWS
jgi:hypothetical protein